MTSSKQDKVMRNIIKGIADNRFGIGDRLPPERALAEEYGISRIIVHSAIVELGAKGLLEIAPRKGVTVADYKRQGNIALLEIMLTAIEEGSELLWGLLDARRLLEEEFARLAALNRTDANLMNLKAIIQKETEYNDIEERAELDFALHHEIAHASANAIYPLLIKSMEGTYLRLIKEFYSAMSDWSKVTARHQSLLKAIAERNPNAAAKVMSELLFEGATYLKKHRQAVDK